MEYIAYHPFLETMLQIRCAEGKIQSITPAVECESSLLLTPGFCDLQVNGGFGIDLNDASLTPQDVILLNQRLLQHGVTAWCPTVITAEHHHMLHNLAVIDTACQMDALLAQCVVGIHLEGPYLSGHEGARGAHPLEFVRKPDLSVFDEYQCAANGRIKIITLAPELDGAEELIRMLSAEGIVVAIGHSMANRQQIQSAVKAGARLATHLGNGLAACVHRHDNPFIHMLAEDGLFASVIFDRHHLPADVRRLILRTKGIDRLVMVSDATRLTGMPPGVYDESIGGKVELSSDRRLSLAGTPYLAGAAMSLLEDVNVMLMEGEPDRQQLLQLSMQNPLGLLRIQPDSLVLLNLNPVTNQFEVVFSAVAGQLYYDPKENQNGATPYPTI
ncbi:MAG: N-acetylglucosamine-6-phosphate deacetylase [Anaerolineae bacterium]|jgi:N-acetylglucosamine-6-phosphate deacetylase|nr:N-acetylglucosamine-6-phosphate deacetylase [Anaerolineae bacterium]